MTRKAGVVLVAVMMIVFSGSFLNARTTQDWTDPDNMDADRTPQSLRSIGFELDDRQVCKTNPGNEC